MYYPTSSGRLEQFMDYNIIYTNKEIHDYISGADVVAFDFETAPDDEWRDEPKAALDAHKAHIVGISLSVKEDSAVYIPLSHKVGANAIDPTGVMEYLREVVFENPSVVKVAHNLSFEAMFLYALGIVVCEPCYDTIAAAQLTLKSKFEFRNLSDSGLKLLSTSLFGADMPDFATVTAGRLFDEMDPADKETLRYACADSDYTLRLYHKFNELVCQKPAPSQRNRGARRIADCSLLRHYEV
jgi:DNA polymerase-1